MIKSSIFVVLISSYFCHTLAGVGEGGEAIGQILNVGSKLMSIFANNKDNCCPAAWKNPQTDARVCIDGTFGDTGCGVGKCNWNGCQCEGGCKSVDKDATIAYVRQFTTMWGYDLTLFATNQCQNLGWWNDRISTLIPIYGCIRVYEDTECKGRDNCFCVGQGHYSLTDFAVSWDNTISSYKKC